MTKKDFELIASTVKALIVPSETRKTIAWAFAHALAATNPRFDAQRFVIACMTKQD